MVLGNYHYSLVQISNFYMFLGSSIISLCVAVPTPRGKTGGRERLQRAGTNRVKRRHAFACKYKMVP